jgi:type II secretory pathway pseudopilin PulG
MTTPAGWYPDPALDGGLRYWDGATWTEHTAPGAPTQYEPRPSGFDIMPPAPLAPRSSGTNIGVVVAVVAVGMIFFVAIGLAIAIPTFLGARERADDRAAMTAARNAATAAKVVVTDAGNYLAVTPEALTQIEPSYAYTTGPSVEPTTVSIDAHLTRFVAAVKSAGGTCWVLVIPAGASDVVEGRLLAGTSCVAANVDTAFQPDPW